MPIRRLESPQPPVPPQYWHRHKNQLQLRVVARQPEPAQLYSVIGLTFTVHVPVTQGGPCRHCAQVWPCESVRLAFRLREGF
jgi:hypothetical protein